MAVGSDMSGHSADQWREFDKLGFKVDKKIGQSINHRIPHQSVYQTERMCCLYKQIVSHVLKIVPLFQINTHSHFYRHTQYTIVYKMTDWIEHCTK